MPFGCCVPLLHHAYCCAQQNLLHPTSQHNKTADRPIIMWHPNDGSVGALSSVYMRLQLTESHKWIEMGREKIAARHWPVVRGGHRSPGEGHSRKVDVNKIWTSDRTLHTRIGRVGRCWTMMIALPFRLSYDLRIYYVSGDVYCSANGHHFPFGAVYESCTAHGFHALTQQCVSVCIQHPYQLSRQRKRSSYTSVCAIGVQLHQTTAHTNVDRGCALPLHFKLCVQMRN